MRSRYYVHVFALLGFLSASFAIGSIPEIDWLKAYSSIVEKQRQRVEKSETNCRGEGTIIMPEDGLYLSGNLAKVLRGKEKVTDGSEEIEVRILIGNQPLQQVEQPWIQSYNVLIIMGEEEYTGKGTLFKVSGAKCPDFILEMSSIGSEDEDENFKWHAKVFLWLKNSKGDVTSDLEMSIGANSHPIRLRGVLMKE